MSRIRVKALSEDMGCFDLPKAKVCMHCGSASMLSCFRNAKDFGGVSLASSLGALPTGRTASASRPPEPPPPRQDRRQR